MKKFELFFFLIIFLLGNVSAQCSEGQININTASLEDLDKITYVGPATAIKIVNMRLFNSVDDLLNVSGIGEAKLKAIKDENLACVEDSGNKEETSSASSQTDETLKSTSSVTSQDNEESSEKGNEVEQTIEPEKKIIPPINSQKNLTQETKRLQVIKLNSKDIKDNNSIQENKEENLSVKYAGFGLIALCILLFILLFLQRKKINPLKIGWIKGENMALNNRENEGIRAEMIMEVIGRPPEHLMETLDKIITEIDKEECVKVLRKKINEPQLIKNEQEFYTTFAEIEVEVKEILYLVMLMFKYMPAHIEITTPEVIALTNNGWNEILNELTRRLHGYDEVARVLQVEKSVLEKRLRELIGKTSKETVEPSAKETKPAKKNKK